MKRINDWIERNRRILKGAHTGFCVGTAATFWVMILFAAICGYKMEWTKR